MRQSVRIGPVAPRATQRPATPIPGSRYRLTLPSTSRVYATGWDWIKRWTLETSRATCVRHLPMWYTARRWSAGQAACGVCARAVPPEALSLVGGDGPTSLPMRDSAPTTLIIQRGRSLWPVSRISLSSAETAEQILSGARASRNSTRAEGSKTNRSAAETAAIAASSRGDRRPAPQSRPSRQTPRA